MPDFGGMGLAQGAGSRLDADTLRLKTPNDFLATLNAVFEGYVEGSEITDPTAPAANKGRIYFKDVGGKVALMVRFPTGAVQQIAIEP
jgi:hypothetical protein